jgi:hypothetical protein
VPDKAEILLVPNKVGILAFGKFIINIGTTINPPPPTTASIYPATKENINNIIILIAEYVLRISKKSMKIISNYDVKKKTESTF